jgi:hypothetical protein
VNVTDCWQVCPKESDADTQLAPLEAAKSSPDPPPVSTSTVSTLPAADAVTLTVTVEDVPTGTGAEKVGVKDDCAFAPSVPISINVTSSVNASAIR